MIQSKTFIAHVRASTYGQVSRSNCHPFISGCWSFAHNGQVADFGSHRRRLEATLSDARYSQRLGNTDSELLFLLLLDHGLNEDVFSACNSVLKLLKQVTSNSAKATRIAAVFSNGDNLYALRYSSDLTSPSLYFSQREEKAGILLASEPLDERPELWSLIPESSLLSANLKAVHHQTLKLCGCDPLVSAF